jgi:hypothetical protein
MTTHRIYKAQGLRGDEVESVTIVLEEEFPDFETQGESIKSFDDTSDRLAEVLVKTLPGGTLDRLIGKLLLKTATSLIVPRLK